MRNKSTLIFLLGAVLLLSSCSKDALKSYENRLEGGRWRLEKVTEIGFPRSIDILSGSYRFYDDGRMTYDDHSGSFFEGEWNLHKYWYSSCFWAESGGTICDDQYFRELSIFAVDRYSSEQIRIHFDNIQFTGTNTFKAYIYERTGTYVFRFRR